MKHLTYAEKSLITGDEIADALVEYAAMLSQQGSAEAVEVSAYGSDSSNVTATLLLGAGAPIMAESATSDLPEPDNSELLARIRREIGLHENPPEAQQLDES
nr:hypothetical protein [Microbacterium lemovicicum]